MKPFELFQCCSCAEAVELLSQYKNKAKIMAGGTALLNQMRQKYITPQNIIYLKNIPELNQIIWENDTLSIGAASSIRDLERNEIIQKEFNILAQAAHKLGGYQTRNLATVGGNLCNAAPSAELAPALLTLGGNLEIVGRHGKRRVLIEEFFLGPYRTVLQDDEILTEIRIPKGEARARGTYVKLGARNSMEMAIVSIAVLFALDLEKGIFQDFRLALGGVAPTPIRIKAAEEAAKNKIPSRDLIREIGQIASAQAKPKADLRASAEYRREMVKALTGRAITQTLKESGYEVEKEASH